MNSGRFKPGQSGNPKGRALESEQRRRLASAALAKHLDRAIEVIGEQLESDEETSSQWASKMVMEYAIGKPTQAVELGDPDGNAIAINVNVIKK